MREASMPKTAWSRLSNFACHAPCASLERCSTRWSCVSPACSVPAHSPAIDDECAGWVFLGAAAEDCWARAERSAKAIVITRQAIITEISRERFMDFILSWLPCPAYRCRFPKEGWRLLSVTAIGDEANKNGTRWRAVFDSQFISQTTSWRTIPNS